MTDAVDAVVDKLRVAAKRRFGSTATVSNIDHATLGGSNLTLLFDLTAETEHRRLVFRQETYTLDPTPFLPPDVQYKLLDVAYRNGVPVPEPIFELETQDELGRGYVVACVDGETLPKRIMRNPEFAAARRGFARQCGEILAKLHSIELTEVGILETVQATEDPVDFQRYLYDGYQEIQPAIEFGLRWLDKHKSKSSKKVFLHGDFRNGNMIVGPSGIKAVLDWECAFLEHPAADFSWLCLRAWRFGEDDKAVGGLGDVDEMMSAYRDNGGVEIDAQELNWWEVYGHLRWALYNVMQVRGHLRGGRRSPAFAACGRNTAMIEHDMLMAIKRIGT